MHAPICNNSIHKTPKLSNLDIPLFKFKYDSKKSYSSFTTFITLIILEILNILYSLGNLANLAMFDDSLIKNKNINLKSNQKE
jgi:hypothetical protein